MPHTRRRLSRAERARRAGEVAAIHDGVAHRRDLRAVGVSRADVRTEITAGRWLGGGRATVVVGNRMPVGRAVLWQAVWESGSGAVLDGVAALSAGGLKGFESPRIDVSVPRGNRSHVVTGVHRHRRTVMPSATAAGLPRVEVAAAAVNACAWVTTERQAALVLCLVLQQRLTSPRRLLDAWNQSTTRFSRRRRRVLAAIVADLCDGARSLGELDFARLCRGAGLPEPTRQAVRVLTNGRVYLDVAWEGVGLVVEIDGGHHALALSAIDDALRQNEVVLRDERVLRIPVIGLRLVPSQFMEQVVRAHAVCAERTAA